MALGIPLLVFSTAILAAIRSTRGAALAALPLQLGIFLLVWRKMPYYIVHECVFFASAIAIGLLVASHYLLARWASKFERAFAPLAVLCCPSVLVKGSPMLADARLTLSPKVHEMELAHAAGERMLGIPRADRRPVVGMVFIRSRALVRRRERSAFRIPGIRPPHLFE